MWAVGIVMLVAFATGHAELERVAQERLDAWVDYELSVLDSGIVPWESWDEGLEPARVYPSYRVRERLEETGAYPKLERGVIDASEFLKRAPRFHPARVEYERGVIRADILDAYFRGVYELDEAEDLLWMMTTHERGEWQCKHECAIEGDE